MKKEVVNHRSKGSGHTPTEAGMMPGRIVVDGLCPSSSSGGIDGVQDGCVCHQFFDGEPGHDMERALLTPGTATLHGLPLLWRKDLGSGVMVSAGAQEFTAKTEGLRAV